MKPRDKWGPADELADALMWAMGIAVIGGVLWILYDWAAQVFW